MFSAKTRDPNIPLKRNVFIHSSLHLCQKAEPIPVKLPTQSSRTCGQLASKIRNEKKGKATLNLALCPGSFSQGRRVTLRVQECIEEILVDARNQSRKHSLSNRVENNSLVSACVFGNWLRGWLKDENEFIWDVSLE